MSFMYSPRTAIEMAAEHRDHEIAARQAQRHARLARQARRQARVAEQLARQAALYEQLPGEASAEWLPKPSRQHTDSVFVLVRRLGDFVRGLAGHSGGTPGVPAR